ncbi:hypothetical protein GGI07_005129 [Coemansia sp. Benny D115]|nr:hypothetical protein GGI07_005129 [Coemansia sp. Benny D115]
MGVAVLLYLGLLVAPWGVAGKTPETPSLTRARERYFLQPLDHFASSAVPILPQSFLVHTEFHKQPSDPIILYSVGERGIHTLDLQANNNWVVSLAKHINAAIVLLEHRFYGDSFPPTDNTDLKYLTVAQSMADTARFIKTANLTWVLGQSVDSDHTRWLMVGGSYAGSLAVWTQYQYPELHAFVWASSAPLKGLVDGYWQFDEAVSRRLGCSAQLARAVQAVDRILDSQDTRTIDRMKREFGLASLDSPVDFAAALAGPVSAMAQAPAESKIQAQMSRFCSHLDTASARGPDDRDIVRGYARALQEVTWTDRPAGQPGCPQGDDLSWFWQQCTQIGLWQTSPEANSAESQGYTLRLRSRRLTAEYFVEQCSRCFPQQHAAGFREGRGRREMREFAASAVREKRANEPADLVLSGGDLDPWHGLFLGTAQRGGLLWVAVEGASHAEDLLPASNTRRGVVRAQESVLRAAQAWLSATTNNPAAHRADAESAPHSGTFHRANGTFLGCALLFLQLLSIAICFRYGLLRMRDDETS